MLVVFHEFSEYHNLGVKKEKSELLIRHSILCVIFVPTVKLFELNLLGAFESIWRCFCLTLLHFSFSCLLNSITNIITELNKALSVSVIVLRSKWRWTNLKLPNCLLPENLNGKSGLGNCNTCMYIDNLAVVRLESWTNSTAFS